MANLPVRDLGGLGVITDTNPYDLPSNAFSDARNVIFDDGRVSRAPLFKQLFPTPTSSATFEDLSEETFAGNPNTFENAEGEPVSDVRFVSSYSDPADGEVAIIADRTGIVRTYPNGELAFATPITGDLITNDEPWAHCQVAGISVLSRGGMVPYGRKIDTDDQYEYFSGDWPATDTCAVIRPYLDYLIALNVTKDAIEYPTMVKWSDPVQIGTEVADIIWDPTNPENIAGENILADLRNPILDGLALQSQFVIYTTDQVYLMEYTGSSLVFNFRRLFPTGGVINSNCVAEVEGKHFVFGTDDIYIHDGISRKSIADGRVRRRIYNNILRDERKKFFAVHDSITSLIYFCYKSVESGIGFENTEFCNMAAVYNYKNDTWSFMDLPNVAGGSEVTFNLTGFTYPDSLNSYQAYNTSYSSFFSDTAKLPTMVGVTDTNNGLTESRTYGVDLPSIGKVPIPAEPETIKEAFVERIGVDLDETGLPLRDYKTIKSMVPQAEFSASNGFLTLKIGSADRASDAIVWRTIKDFRPSETDRIDTKASGKYLAYRLSMNDIEDFKFSGFDVEVISTSKR
jgi:hypothetical protein